MLGRSPKSQKGGSGNTQQQVMAETEVIVTGTEADVIDPTTGKKCEGPKWKPTSKSLLAAAEKLILSHVKTPFKGKFVDIGPTVGKKDSEIWTISNTDNGEDKTPVVLVHGFASGAAMWALNLDQIAEDRPVYAIDLLGFARSSRPTFSSKPEEVESELAQSIEDWREKIGLERFVLVGHSMGGFLSTAYTLRYPERVAHLVLADPWGYSVRPDDADRQRPLAWWIKAIGFVLSPFNPLATLRAAGPWGPGLVARTRGDLNDKFSQLSEDGHVSVSEYIYHCNAQKPTGESAFHTLQSHYGWAKNPMINRIHSIPEKVPMTFLYGSRSWVNHCPKEMLEEKRPSSFVDVHVLQGASHHVYADNREEFNELVLKAAAFSDKKGYEENLSDEINRKL